MTVEDGYRLVDGYLLARRAHIAAGTLVECRLTLRRFVRSQNGAVSSEDIENWLWSVRHLAPGTRRLMFSQIRVWFRWLTAEGHIDVDPFLRLIPPKVPRQATRSLSAGQTAALLAVCPDERARCIVLLGLQLGLRRAEIAGVEVGDIDLVRGTLLVRHGKGGHARLVPLTADAGRAIGAYLAVSPARAGPLVRGVRYPTVGVTPHWVGDLVRRLAVECGIKTCNYDGVSTHALRHTAAADVYERSNDVLAVRDLLGHVSLATTQVYLGGLSVERLRAAVEGRHYG